ncbi:MAG: heparinase II/III family protein [Flavobacterium sp.]|nr:heparinase II/III family protein [Flavobacterium sp.]
MYLKKANVCIFLLMLLVVAKSSAQNNLTSHKVSQQFVSEYPSEKQWKNIPAHPRLFANNSRIESLKLQNDEVSKELLLLLKNNAEKTLKSAKIEYPATGFKFSEVRNVQGRILTLGLAYRVFGDKRYFERAKAELMQLAELPDWCPTHFLDVGEATLAAGVGYDWLYNDLTPAERETITQAIIKNGINPSLDAKESNENKSWLNGNFNWNPVCNGGLLVGALAIYESEPKLARQIVERSIKYIPNHGAVYAPDGTYAEGTAYWSYGTTFQVVMIEALRSVFGSSFKIESFPGFLKTTNFITQIVGPTGYEYPFSDAGHEGSQLSAKPLAERYTSEPIMLWFARENGSRVEARDEINSIALAKSIVLNDTLSKAQKSHSRHFALEVLWWDPKLPAMDKNSFLPLHWTADGHMPIAVIRSAWNDPLASYVAIKGGTPNNSHGHMDVGSFILEANGVRWTLDLGGESYDKMRAAKLDLWNYSQDSNRWTTFRPGPDSHNILRFNNARQDVSGLATISKLSDKKGVVGNVVDLTSLYKSQVEKVSRTVKMFPNKSITIQDEWQTGEKGVEYTFQWVTGAKVSLRPYGALLEQNGKSMKLKIEVINSKLKPEILIEDVSKSKAPQDSDNPGVSRLLIKLNSLPLSKTVLKITTITLK